MNCSPAYAKRKRVVHMDFDRRILPYYMTYPGPYGTRREDTVIRDMEYLQQLYPAEVRRYQRRVAQILDRMDYEGSMIYDEYPDRFSLERLAGGIINVLKSEEADTASENPTSPEKWLWLQDLILVLLYNEVYKRRHGGRRGMFWF
jgi:hypothetical protein